MRNFPKNQRLLVSILSCGICLLVMCVYMLFRVYAPFMIMYGYCNSEAIIVSVKDAP